MSIFKGSGVAIVTPFDENLEVDLKKLGELINFQIENGTDAIIICGTTGESATLKINEQKACISEAVKIANKRVPVIAGTGSNDTAHAIELSVQAQKCGADALLVVTPYYNKPTQEGLYQHYKAIANSVEIAFMLYNVPGRTGVDLEANTAIRLFDDVKNIYAIKEATGSLERAICLLSQRKDFVLISGDDAVDFPMLVSGAKGIISVTANLLPNLKSQLVKHVFDGNFDAARKLNEDLYELNNVLFCESNPIPIKAAMYLAGLLDTLEYRLPLTAPSAETMKKLEKTLEKYEVIK